MGPELTDFFIISVAPKKLKNRTGRRFYCQNAIFIVTMPHFYCQKPVKSQWGLHGRETGKRSSRMKPGTFQARNRVGSNSGRLVVFNLIRISSKITGIGAELCFETSVNLLRLSTGPEYRHPWPQIMGGGAQYIKLIKCSLLF